MDTQYAHKKHLISVIVPVYKVEDYLRKCIESIINQTYKELDIILVDDGSPDRCPEICDEYLSIDGRIRVIHKINGGLASARNAGLDLSIGDFIAFVDSDDWVEDTAYERMTDMLVERKLDAVCSAANRVKNGSVVGCCFKYYPTGTILPGEEVLREVLLDHIGSQVVKFLYRKEMWKGVRFPIGRLYEDIPVTFKALRNAQKVGFISEPLYNYRDNPISISSTPNRLKSYHIYLGFKEHYIYASTHIPDIADSCRMLTAHYAISTFFHYCCNEIIELRDSIEDVTGFLDSNKREIIKGRGILCSRRVALRFYYFSKGLFLVLCRLLKLTGLRRVLHLEEK